MSAQLKLTKKDLEQALRKFMDDHLFEGLQGVIADDAFRAGWRAASVQLVKKIKEAA